jgi:ketoreductase RED2
MSSNRLQGMVALVSGSSSGIGRALVAAFAAEGASVVVNSNTSRTEGLALAASFDDAIYVQGSVARVEDCERLVAAALGRWGRLDILVNCAGTTANIPHDDLAGADVGVWKDIFDVNLFGTWSLSRAAMPALRESRGSILNISSMSGERMVGSSIPYAASKAAVNHLTLLLAKAVGPEVRVNAIAPGLIDTPWTADWAEQRVAVSIVAPLRRSGTPDDLAEIAISLSLSSYITGAIVPVDGGLRLSI